MDKSQRNIRVFISSTFRDMFAEREELVKFTFPELRKRCRERHVEFTDVDLRWGITDEQKAEGKVLPICLAEIERCQPYFVGILGERYGWVPEEIDEELVKTQKWLEEHRKKSVTELEMIHGVLQDPSMKKLAYFYFRDQVKSEEIEEELKKQPDYVPEPESSKKKLDSLKQRIEESGYSVYKNYPDVKALGHRVLEDLWAAIDHRFPEEEIPSALERERMEHEAYAEARRKVYIGREEYLERLDKHVESEDPPLVILGESGSGKSALLSNWALKYQENHPDIYVHLHFIGSSAYSADWAAMLRRIMGEFKQRFDIQQDIPDKLAELRAAFANWLHMTAAKGRVILILDGLNQLEDREGALDLVWLPPVIPPNIRLILSTLPGKPLDDLLKRGWPNLNVKLLDHKERKNIIVKYLAQYTKELNPEHTKQISQSEQTANPLYLKALLEELRLFGRYEQLDERINFYLMATTIPELYEKILTRYEEDYEKDRKGLVRDVMCCLWAARKGLAESELLDILGKDDSPLPNALWSPLYLAAEQSLVIRSGLINFSHDYLRQAVRNRYLKTEDNEKSVHLSVADYFSNLEVSKEK